MCQDNPQLNYAHVIYNQQQQPQPEHDGDDSDEDDEDDDDEREVEEEAVEAHQGIQLIPEPALDALNLQPSDDYHEP